MDAKKILKKSEILNMDYLNFVVEAAASSCRFGFIKEIQPKNKYHLERANINVIIAMPLGSGKTTSLLSISDSHQANDVTFPGMVGSINKEGEFVPGAILKAAGNVLFLDEFNRVPRDVKDAMNNLMEQRAHPRNIGFKVKKNFSRNTKYFSVKVKDNYIYTRARFSTIASTMYLKLKESGNMSDIAWFTRFIPVRFIPDLDYYEKLTKGEKMLRINPKLRDIEEFIFKDYMKANEYYWETVKKTPFWGYFERNAFHRGALPRIFKDIERLAAFVASLNNRSKIKFDDFKFAMKFLPNLFSNYIAYDLSEHEQKILEMTDMKEEQIAAILGISQGAVSKIFSRLKEKGLINH